MKVTCAYCGKDVQREVGAVNRALKAGLNIYCDRKCAGLGRRVERTEAERKELKRLYDEKRRIDLADRIKAQHAAYFKRTYDPGKAAIERKKRMPYHVEYCRRPEYRAYKREYDKVRRSKLVFGEFYEAAILLWELETEIADRATKQDIRATNGTLNKWQTRRRDYERNHRN